MHEYLISLQGTGALPLNRGSVIWHFERSDAIEVCDGIIFDFYLGLDGDLPEHSMPCML